MRINEVALLILAITTLTIVLIIIKIIYNDEKKSYDEWQRMKDIDTKKRLSKINRKREELK